MDFVEEMNSWQEIDLPGGETRSGLIDIEANFPDPEGLLETAYAYLRRMKCLPLRVVTRQATTSVFEEYIFATAPGLITISANDTEGIRRGLYRAADLLRAYTPDKLPEKCETITPKIRLRFCRYSFGSEKHPSSFQDFAPDFDYYPESFLERMAAEGANVIWFTALTLPRTCLNDWYPENAEAKLGVYERMQRTIDRCRRYGLRLFAYMVIPVPFNNNDPLLQSHPDIRGPHLFTYNLFCTASEDGQRYLYECARQLFSSVHHLGGLLTIVQGEGAAFCPDVITAGGSICNTKCGLSVPEIYAKGISAIFDGMRSAEPDADLIAWFYLPFDEKAPDYLEKLVQLTSKDIIYQCNAESGAKPVQLGKPRLIGDYWQAFAGTSPVFDDFAGIVLSNGGRLGAKIQVGASHEVGSVPYVPVPALTYRKYATLQSRGVSMVMQGWKTGGTPGMMNLTAGLLSFTDCSKVSEQEFLLELATILWGAEVAPDVVRGWEMLSEAYTHYPYSNMIQYFGPVADGVNWPLYVKFTELPLRATWSMNDGEISGDTIWECLNNHSFAEAVQLFGELSRLWHEGSEIFRSVAARIKLNRQQQFELDRIEALEILFGTAGRIFRFYELRNQYLNGDKTALQEMRAITLKEIAERRRLLSIIAVDTVIGYNPEAHGNKFSPQSITKGLAGLQKTLADLDEAETTPVPPPVCHGTAILDGSVNDRGNLSWSGIIADGKLKIKARCPGHFKNCDEMFFAFDDKGEHGPIIGHFDNTGRIFVFPRGCECLIHSDDDGWSADMTFTPDALPGGNPGKCRFNIMRLMDDYEHRCTWPGAITEFLVARLNLAFYDSRDMGDLRLS